MKFAPPQLRYMGMALMLAFLARNGALGQGDIGFNQIGHPPGPDPVEAKKNTSSVTLAPEVEKKLQDLLDRTKLSKGEYWDDQMKKEIDEIAKVTGMKDEGWQILDAALKPAVKASLDAWSPKMPDEVRRGLAMMPKEQALAMLDQAQDQIGAMAMVDLSGDMVAPEDQDIWAKALRQALTPGQLDAWTQVQTKRKDDIEKEIGDALKNGADRTRTEEKAQVELECKRIETALNLPKERADKLEALGKTAVEQSVASWRQRMEKSLLALDETQRRPLLANGFYLEAAVSGSALDQPVWQEGLRKIVTADDSVLLKAAGETRKAKRCQVMGKVMIMLLDDKVALTATQREKLEPIADRLVKDVPDLYPQVGPNNYYSVTPDLFYQAAEKAPSSEIRPILDDLQWKHWQELRHSASPTFNPNVDLVDKSRDFGKTDDTESIISNFFYDKTQEERQRSLAVNVLKAEDITRVAGLGAESTQRLEVAARGVTEEHLMTWKWFVEQQIRSQLQDLTPDNVKQRLTAMQGFFFQQNFGMPNPDTLWDKTVETELTAKQQAAWKTELDARQAYRENAISGLVLAEFDRQNELSDAQWSKLQPIISGVVHDYADGITQIFSGMNGVPWYMGGPYVLIPFAGIDDAQLKTILSEEQFAAWTGSPGHANASNIWQVVKQMHAQRARANSRMIITD